MIMGALRLHEWERNICYLEEQEKTATQFDSVECMNNSGQGYFA